MHRRSLTVLALLWPAGAAQAVVFPVTNLNDNPPALITDCNNPGALQVGSLRWAIASANAAAGGGQVQSNLAGTVVLNNFCDGMTITNTVNWSSTHAFVVDASGIASDTFVIAAPGRTVEFRSVVVRGGVGTRGARVSAGTFVFRDGKISDHQLVAPGAPGAGIRVAPAGGVANLTLIQALIFNNRSVGDGAGVFFDGNGSLNITHSLIRANESGGRGAGIMFSPNGAAASSLIQYSTLAFNKTPATAGGLAVESVASPFLSLHNVTIANNTADTSGGGVTLISGGLVANRVTIANNSSPTGSQIHVSAVSGSTDISNSIINGAATACSGNVALLSGGFDVVTDATCGGLTGAVPGLPNLNGLTNNGGSCGSALFPCLTMKPNAPSPAIDFTPACSTVDQRGVPRGPAPCWSGAYEN